MFDGSAKVLAHLPLLENHKQGVLTPPTTVELDLTNFCPHTCPLCVGGRTNMTRLDTGVVTELLAHLADYGVKAIVFTGGGEPTSHPAAVDLVQYARELGMQCGLITNGTNISTRPEMAAPLVEACTWIRVSIDAGDAATYRHTHGVDWFDAAWNSVLVLSTARGDGETTIGVGYLLGNRTIDGMYKATMEARERGANYIQMRPFIEEAGSMTTERLKDRIAECKRLERPGFRVGYLPHKYCGSRVYERKYTRCHGSFMTSVIQADGNVALCCLYRGQDGYYGGNIHETLFRDIWEGERMAKLRDIDVSKCPPLCRHDTLNELVDALLRPKDHSDFL